MNKSNNDIEKDTEAQAEILKLKQQILELLRENKEYKNLYNKSPLSYQSLDTNGNILNVNQAWLDSLEYTREEVIGHNFAEFLEPDWVDHFNLNFPKLKSMGEVMGVEFKMIKKGGERILISLSGSIGRDTKGNFLQSYCIIQDITQRRLLKIALEQSEKRFRNAITYAPYPIMIHADGKVLQLSKEWITQTGYTIDDIPTIKKWLLKAYGKDAAPSQEFINNLYKLEKTQYDGEWKVKIKDGRDRLWDFSSSPIGNLPNGEKMVISMASDITDRKKAEEENIKLYERLQQSQKMESIGTLAGGIAHDFNNILSVIFGYAEMAKDACQPGSSISKDLDEVLGASNRAKGLVQQILAFSRQDDMERIILQPASIVKETIKMLRPALPTTIEITQDIDAVTGLVFVAPSHLNQILMNLCTNSFHAMEDTGGKLDISLKEVTLNNGDLLHEPDVMNGTFIQLSIADSGTGITPTVKDNIFDPFFTTKETGKGTGMGLSMVHGIVKSYGGFISLDSDFGKGSVFHVFLPVVEKGALPENKINDRIPTGRERILFVDDEEILTRMGKTMLERLGYHVTARCSSLEALATFQNQAEQFDLVITDQTMPGMTGSDLSKRMLQIRPDIPIILCTGYSTVISEAKAKSMGIKEFAFKPLSKKDVAKLIRKVLDVS